MITVSSLEQDPRPLPPGIRTLVRAGDTIRNDGHGAATVRIVQHGLLAGDIDIKPGHEHVAEFDCSVSLLAS